MNFANGQQLEVPPQMIPTSIKNNIAQYSNLIYSKERAERVDNVEKTKMKI